MKPNGPIRFLDLYKHFIEILLAAFSGNVEQKLVKRSKRGQKKKKKSMRDSEVLWHMLIHCYTNYAMKKQRYVK